MSKTIMLISLGNFNTLVLFFTETCFSANTAFYNTSKCFLLQFRFCFQWHFFNFNFLNLLSLFWPHITEVLLFNLFLIFFFRTTRDVALFQYHIYRKQIQCFQSLILIIKKKHWKGRNHSS